MSRLFVVVLLFNIGMSFYTSEHPLDDQLVAALGWLTALIFYISWKQEERHRP